jgi:hypothetical protein
MGSGISEKITKRKEIGPYFIYILHLCSYKSVNESTVEVWSDASLIMSRGSE